MLQASLSTTGGNQMTSTMCMRSPFAGMTELMVILAILLSDIKHESLSGMLSEVYILTTSLPDAHTANIRSGKSRFTLLLSQFAMHHSFDHLVELGFDLRLEVSLQSDRHR